MGIVESKTFVSGSGVAVELPAEVAFAPGISVTIERVGNVLTVRPATLTADDPGRVARWRAMLMELDTLPRPPDVEARDPIEFPERPGL